MYNYETIEQYFSHVINLVNNIQVYRDDIPDRKMIETILRTMAMKFDHMVTKII